MIFKTFPGWASHLPVLVKAFQVTEGDTLELGIGYYSTPFLHWSCNDTGRKLTSYEANPQYFHLFRGYFTQDWHKGNLVTDWDKVEIDRPWGLAFVDHESDRRAKDITRLADNARLIIAHDSEPKWHKQYLYPQVFNKFKYIFNYDKANPNTIALSNFIDVKRLFG